MSYFLIQFRANIGNCKKNFNPAYPAHPVKFLLFNGDFIHYDGFVRFVAFVGRNFGNRINHCLTFGDLPELMEVRRGAQSLIGFPALIDKLRPLFGAAATLSNLIWPLILVCVFLKSSICWA